jgi:hypothetical protein
MLIDMRRLFALFVLAALSFAVGGGGSTILTFTMEKDFSCPGNKLTVTAYDQNGPVSGVELKLSLFSGGPTLATAVTDQEGEAAFVIDKGDGAYKVVGTKSGYSISTVLVTIEACKTEPTETFFCEEGDLKERLRCVMNLPDDDVLNVRYVPEECRVLDEEGKQRCIGLYRVLQSCRIESYEGDEAREGCIKPKLNLSDNISGQYSSCGDQACRDRVRQNVYTMVKFRIYNLIYKAEEMRELGVAEDEVVDFVAYIEEAKVRFNNAASITGKKLVIQEVKAKWEEFRDRARPLMGVEG